MYRNNLKRILDLMLSLVLIIFFSWLFLMIALGYLVTSNGPVIYRQWRIGKGGGVFPLYKFRTFTVDETVVVAERQFAFGSFLRRCSLDELPQLINVIQGHMSLIGPRPLPVAYASLFSTTQNKRHEVRPGITGLAQVNGRNTISWQEKFIWDVQYVNQLSFLLDIKIAWKTVVVLFSFRKDVSLEEKAFEGEQ